MDSLLSQMISAILDKLEELIIEIIKMGEANSIILSQLMHLFGLLTPVMDLVEKEFPKSSYLLNVVEKVIGEANK